MTQFRSSLIAFLGIFLLASCDRAPLPTAPGVEGAAMALAAAAAPPPATQVTTGNFHSCALGTDGVVRCWGLNADGQAPAERAALTGSFTQVSGGRRHTCALRNDGVIECWGWNGYGQAPATRTAAAGVFTEVSAGEYHTCGLRSDNVGECWGWSPEGMSSGPGLAELADAAVCALTVSGTARCPNFTKSATTGTFVQVVGYARSSAGCALRTDGVAECWGDQGEGSSTRSATTGFFTKISGYCGIRNDGVIECTRSTFPSTITAGNGVFTDLDNSVYHGCALRSDGIVQCWGDNTYGQAPPVAFSGPIPGPPTSFSAVVVSPDRVDLSWTDTISNETSFLLERRTSTGGTAGAWAAIASAAANATTFSDTTANAEQVYEYRISACNGSGCSVTVPFGPVSTQSIPGAPGGVTATPVSTTGIDVTWTDRSGNETQFRVQRIVKDGTTGTWQTVALLGANASRYEDRNLTAGTTYQYRVRACNTAGCSAWVGSNDAMAPTVPVAPTSFTSSSPSSSRIDLSWTDASSNETSFTLTRRVRNADGSWSSWLSIATLSANTTSYSNTGLAPGTYQYRVRACNLAGCSAYAASPETATLPPMPTNPTATAVSPTAVQLGWTDTSANETYYQLGRRTRNADGSWSGFQTLGARPAANSTSYQDTGLAPGTGYQYRIRACNASGCSLPALTPEAVTPAN